MWKSPTTAQPRCATSSIKRPPEPTPGRSSHPAPTNVSHPRNRPTGSNPTQWKDAFLAYFDTGREPATAPPEAINGIIKTWEDAPPEATWPTNYQLECSSSQEGLNHTQLSEGRHTDVAITHETVAAKRFQSLWCP